MREVLRAARAAWARFWPPRRSVCAGYGRQKPWEAGFKVLAAQLAEPLAPGCALQDHAGLAQHAEVVRRRRLRHWQAESPAWALALGLVVQRPHDLQPHGIAECLEHVLQADVL